MTKKTTKLIIGCITFAMVLSMALMTGCGKSKDNIVTIEKSDGAKEYENNNIINNGEKQCMEEENFDKTIQLLAGRGEQVLPECEVNNTLACEKLDGYNVYTLTNTEKDYENVILYIHGGAWMFEISTAHVTFCDELATRMNAKVYMPLYPLAPEANAEQTYAFIEKVYKKVLKEGKNVYIMGDSAGGNLALGLMYIIKEKDLEKPAKMVVMAPCSDMSFSNEEIAELDKTDPLLSAYGCKRCAEIWAGKDNLKDPQYSPVYADVSDYPDTMIVQGTNDILCPDNMILYENMKDKGVDVTLVKGEDLWHVFGVYPIPEREKVLKLVTKFCLN